MNFVRYADDFIITGESPEFLREKVLPIVREFLTERGLQLSEEKTVITHIGEGFDFLGKNIRKYNGKLLIRPCKSAVKSFLGKVRDIIKSSKSIKQEILIRRLNPVIRGWVNNQRYVVSSKVFSTVDYEIYKCLWQWAKRRHKEKEPQMDCQEILARYRLSPVWTFSVPYEDQEHGGQTALLQTRICNRYENHPI